MKQTITIEVDVPPGYEAFAFRRPLRDELFINTRGELDAYDTDALITSRYLIVRRAFAWPAWLKCAAIAKDRNGSWRGYQEIPELCKHEEIWHHRGLDRHFLSVDILDIDLPDVPWEQSLRINPNWKPE